MCIKKVFNIKNFVYLNGIYILNFIMNYQIFKLKK